MQHPTWQALVFDALGQARRNEGAKLAHVLTSQMNEIGTLTAKASALAATVRAWSGFEMPKPMQSGNVVCVRSQRSCSSSSGGSSLRSPVMPTTLTQ